MRIAYMSDLHLDFHGDFGECFLKGLEVPQCDLMVIAGDLMEATTGNWEDCVTRLCKMAPQVLYVLGNHEFYHASIPQVEAMSAKLMRKIKNLKIVSNAEVFEIAGVTILAGTLWFKDYPDQAQFKKYLSDFKYIKNLEPEIYYKNTQFDIKLHGVKDQPCVVVSHHMPSYRVVNYKYAGSAMNRFFVGGEFDEAIKDSQIKYWICGHGHDRIVKTIGNCQIASNPFGYPNEVPYDWQVRTVDI